MSINKFNKNTCTTQTVSQRVTAVATQTDTEIRETVSSQIPLMTQSNLRDKSIRTAKSSGSYKARYAGKRIKLDNIVSEEEEEEEIEEEKIEVKTKGALRVNNQFKNVQNDCVHKDNKKTPAQMVPGKAPKKNYTIRTIQKENSDSSQEKILVFNVI